MSTCKKLREEIVQQPLIGSVEKRISERECKLYDQGLNSKVKLALYI